MIQEMDDAGEGTQYLLQEGRPFQIGQLGARQLKLSKIPPSVETFELAQNCPNPFNPATTIRFQLPEPASVQMEIINLRGQRARPLITDALPAGFHRVSWDARDDNGKPATTGIYFYRLRANNFECVRKMLLLR